MNRRPGVVDPENGLVPFGRFERLHFARFVVLDDRTADDIAAHGVTPVRYPPSLAFVGDCDGPADEFLGELEPRRRTRASTASSRTAEASPGAAICSRG